MADKKISALTALAQGDVAVSTDVLPIVDTSATETKKIAVNALVGAAAAAGLTNVDINSGTIDGATIATSDITVGAGKTLNVSAGTLTLADNQISGDKVEGGTINAITINTLTSTAVNATTVDATNIEVTNLKAKDGTAAGSIADSTGVVTLASSVLTTTDINGGTIDGTAIGASSASTGAFSTISASGNLTLSGGTANGVLYLDGSKVATSGTALSYDGTVLTLTATDLPRVKFTGSTGGGDGWIDTFGTTLRLVNNTGSGATSILGNGQINISTAGGSPIVFTTSGSEQMRLNSTGLGIGTSSPAYKVDVAGQAKTTNGFIVNNGTNAGFFTTDGTNVNFGSSTSAKGLAFFVGASSQAALLDSSGNLGLGVTPSAWNTDYRALQIKGGISLSNDGSSTDLRLGQNVFVNSSAENKYIATAAASRYRQSSGSHIWDTAASGTAGNTISFTQAMTLTASGNQLLGTTSETAGTRLKIVDTTPAIRFEESGSGGAKRLDISVNASGEAVISAPQSAQIIAFSTVGTERARITSGGVVAVNTTGAVYSSEKLAVLAANNSVAAAFKTDAGATEYTIAVSNTATSGDNKFVVFATESTDTIRGSITYNRGAGQVAYNVTSDVRLKDNITNAADAGNKVDALQVRQFDWKETGNHVDYGFVAQELHEVVPHSVSKPEDDGQMWSVDYSKLVPMLVKEIQSLRARVAQLESK